MIIAPVRYPVAVTARVGGVVHTYMAAERPEKLYQQEKWSIKTETQGALGTENHLTEEDISHADVVLLITDIKPAGAERFTQSRYVQSGISVFLREPYRVMNATRKLFSAPQHTHLILDQLLSPSIDCDIADGILMASVRYSCETGGRSSCC